MPDIRHSLQIAAAPEAIFPFISTANGLAQWWSQDVTQAGSEIELGFFNRTTIYRLRNASSRPPHQIEWLCESGKEWAGTRLIFHLDPVKAGTLLRFTHANWERTASPTERRVNIPAPSAPEPIPASAPAPDGIA